MNEAGSKEVNSLAFKGAPTVPLIESHAATRERWSFNSVTMSSTERIRRRLPGFETICKENRGAVGVQLRETIQRVRRCEEKSFHHRIQGNAAVDKAMRDMAQAEEAAARRQRADFQAECQRKRSMRAEIVRFHQKCPDLRIETQPGGTVPKSAVA